MDSDQCDQIGPILEVLGNIFAYKSSPKDLSIFGLFLKKITFCKCCCCFYIWATFGNSWTTFLLQYLVTLSVTIRCIWNTAMLLPLGKQVSILWLCSHGSTSSSRSPHRVKVRASSIWSKRPSWSSLSRFIHLSWAATPPPSPTRRPPPSSSRHPSYHPFCLSDWKLSYRIAVEKRRFFLNPKMGYHFINGLLLPTLRRHPKSWCLKQFLE